MAYKVSQSADLNLFRGVASIRHSLACFNDDEVSVNIGRVCYKKSSDKVLHNMHVY